MKSLFTKITVPRWARNKRFWIRSFFYTFLTCTLALGALVFHYDKVVRVKFEGKRWAIPAKVYARPLELFVGQSIQQQLVIAELERLQYKASPSTQTLRPGQYHTQPQKLEVMRRGFKFWDADEPTLPISIEWSDGKISQLRNAETQRPLTITRMDPLQIGGIYPTHGEDRHLVSLDQVPKQLIEGLIAIEDQAFYDHWGVSWRGIARAAWVNLSAGRFQQGGSTLTQQLVKNFYLTSERTLSRKFRELIMAMLLEFHYEKDEILETYLNEVFLGQSKNRAVHGVGLASQFYFGVPVSELSTDQSALIIAMVKGASYYNPRRNPKRAKKRRDLVLDEMFAANIINEAQLQDAKSKSLGVLDKPSYTTKYYPAYIDLVKRQLLQDYRDTDLQSEGLRLFTSLDPNVQYAAEQALQQHLTTLEKRNPNLQGLEGAVVVASVTHGEVLATVGGRQLRYQGFNRALDAKRPIGSLVKPAILLAAFESQKYHLGSIISDTPITITLENGTTWTPINYDKKNHGDVTIMQSLSASYNQSMVRLGMDVGVDKVMAALKRLGLAHTPTAVPSRLLGALEASPFEMAVVYQTIANNGFSNPLKAIRTVLDAKGEPLSRYDLSVKQAFEEADINQVQYALTQVMQHGTGRSHLNQLPHFKAAGKTGTSDAQRDAWFGGISQDYVIAVWVGFDDNRKTQITGASGALPIWTDIMKRLDAKPFEFTLAPDLEYTWIDPIRQAQSAESCADAIEIPMRTSAIPSQLTPCAAQQKSPIKRVKEGVKRWFQKIF